MRRTSKEECFFGRKTELLSLADHATSESVLGNVTRLAARAVGSDQPVMTVWGVGGVGKTTLISKFMLQHAEVAQQRRRFPYAYIDFDRAIVSARDRAGLLVEICSQVMSQFGDLATELQQLKNRLEDVARKMASRPEGASISLLRPCAYEFRTILDRYLSARESRFGIAVPFLIVFDTFEIVQYHPTMWLASRISWAPFPRRTNVGSGHDYAWSYRGDKSWSVFSGDRSGP